MSRRQSPHLRARGQGRGHLVAAGRPALPLRQQHQVGARPAGHRDPTVPEPVREGSRGPEDTSVRWSLGLEAVAAARSGGVGRRSSLWRI